MLRFPLRHSQRAMLAPSTPTHIRNRKLILKKTILIATLRETVFCFSEGSVRATCSNDGLNKCRIVRRASPSSPLHQMSTLGGHPKTPCVGGLSRPRNSGAADLRLLHSRELAQPGCRMRSPPPHKPSTCTIHLETRGCGMMQACGARAAP